MFKSWKTSLFGLIAGAPMLAATFGIPDFGHIGHATGLQIIGGIGGLLMAAYAKDSNVTGGTVKQ